jgi:hypothetical protein
MIQRQHQYEIGCSLKRKLDCKRVSRAEEIAYYDTIQKEYKERKINTYYEENKYKLMPIIIIGLIITSPFIASKYIYNYCKNKDCCMIYPEKNSS